jgi:phosphoribulokinase
MQQLKLRLDEEVVKLLKNQAKLQGIPFNTLCQKILATAVSKSDTLLVSSDSLGLQIDLAITTLRSLEKAVNLNK